MAGVGMAWLAKMASASFGPTTHAVVLAMPEHSYRAIGQTRNRCAPALARLSWQVCRQFGALFTGSDLNNLALLAEADVGSPESLALRVNRTRVWNNR